MWPFKKREPKPPYRIVKRYDVQADDDYYSLGEYRVISNSVSCGAFFGYVEIYTHVNESECKKRFDRLMEMENETH